MYRLGKGKALPSRKQFCSAFRKTRKENTQKATESKDNVYRSTWAQEESYA
jgi:hypothetical protein